MVATVREKANESEPKVSAPPLNRIKSEPKRRQATQSAFETWAQRISLSGFMLVIWCLLNALILAETKTYNWQRQQVSFKEMRARQLQASIAQRLSSLVKNPSQLPKQPVLLSVNSSKPKPTLMGRR
ncbi:MAG: hypothetical protein LASZOEIN_001288 [Candidatus Fervidibacter sp.]|jgi:uncharacterized protein HemX